MSDHEHEWGPVEHAHFTGEPHRIYLGVWIYRNTDPTKLRWVTISPMLAADTLAGIRRLIRAWRGQ